MLPVEASARRTQTDIEPIQRFIDTEITTSRVDDDVRDIDLHPSRAAGAYREVCPE